MPTAGTLIPKDAGESIPSIERAPHSAHHGRDPLALDEFPAWRSGDCADSLDAQHAREHDVGRVALTREHFRPVKTERHHPDQHLPSPRPGTARLSILRTSGPPGASMTTARIVSVKVDRPPSSVEREGGAG